LLSEGHTLFYGGAHAAAKWFQRFPGAAVPFGVNVADHILDLACGDVPGQGPEEGSALRLRLVDAFRDREIGARQYAPPSFRLTVFSCCVGGAGGGWQMLS
jgi:hypothetical protein